MINTAEALREKDACAPGAPRCAEAPKEPLTLALPAPACTRSADDVVVVEAVAVAVPSVAWWPCSATAQPDSARQASSNIGMRTVYAPGRSAYDTPTMLSRVTSCASACSSMPSVPSGRRGSTM